MFILLIFLSLLLSYFIRIDINHARNSTSFIGGALSAIGSIAGAAIGSSSAKATNRANSLEAQRSRDFTKEQLQNQHQWEVEDLKKAGLNPVLSANHSGPGVGSSAQAQMINPGDSMARGVEAAATAMTLKRMNAETKNIQQDTKRKKAETQLQKAQLPGVKGISKKDSSFGEFMDRIWSGANSSAKNLGNTIRKNDFGRKVLQWFD